MAQNVTIMGASYSAVPAVTLPKTGGGTARFDDTSDANATANDIIRNKTAYVNGSKITGNIAGHADLVMFTTDDDYLTYTCNMTFGQCLEILDTYLETAACLRDTTSGVDYIYGLVAGSYNSTEIHYVFGGQETGKPYADIVYHSNGNIEWVSPSTASAVIQPLSITQNGTYTSSTGVDGYSPVVVNVPGGGKACQISNTVGRATSSTYTAVGPSITVQKAGTYHVYWSGYRSSTSGTNGSQLYVNGTSRGSAQTSFNTGTGLTNTQSVHLTNIALNANDVLTIRARSRGNNYYMYVQDLIIIEA